MINLPDLAVGEDHPFDALIDGIGLDLSQVFGAELLGASLHLYEGHELFVNAHPVVGELAFDLVLRGQILELVEAHTFAKEIGDEETSVALICISFQQVMERLAETTNGSAHSSAGILFPLRNAADLPLCGLRLRGTSPRPAGRDLALSESCRCYVLRHTNHAPP